MNAFFHTGRAHRIGTGVLSLAARTRDPGLPPRAVATRMVLVFATVTAMVAAAVAPAQPPEQSPPAAADDAAPLSAGAVERLDGIATGQSQVEPGREDVALVLRGLRDRDGAIGSRACLAVEKIAPQQLFAPEDMPSLWESLRPKLRSADADTGEWSARALAALARHTDLLAGEMPGEALDETLRLVSSDDSDWRRRGAVIAGGLVRILSEDDVETLVRGLLADRPGAGPETMAIRALGRAAPHIASSALADDVATRLRAVTAAVPAGETVAIEARHGLAQLAERKTALERGARPRGSEEQDVAFFERRYRTKITGVKPKEQYGDPDQFYAAIGKALGIPDIAWRAAAAKFGWKQDDGRQTFTILKGGPTAEGGEGSWDVMFIRSAINPATRRPDPATVERVMVQIDYDGKVSFPEELPAGIR